MHLDIQPTAAVPIYEQIVAQVTYLIASGALEPGTRIDSVRELAEQLAVNPNTVARAYQELERNGVVEAKRGVGMEVTPDGRRLAEKQRQQIVRDRIREALREAKLALPPEELRQVIEEELAQVNGKATSKGKR